MTIDSGAARETGSDAATDGAPPLPSCDDGKKNGTETDLDCGGTCPKTCELGKACKRPADCQSSVCRNYVCAEQADTCNNGQKDPDEGDLDCGVVCALKCGEGQSCNVDQDCEGGTCDAQKKCAGGLLFKDVIDNRADYPGSQIPTYEKFEITFQLVNVTATNPQLPYDPSPPAGINPSQSPRYRGISVDAVFSADNFQTSYQQPAFYAPIFEQAVKNGQEWNAPTGQYAWKVRFAPHKPGAWQYKLVAQEASGKAQSSPVAFTVVASSNKGFLHPGKKDPRYFEFDNGEKLFSLGVHLGGENGVQRPVSQYDGIFKGLADNNIRLLRFWINNLYGAAWQSWQFVRDRYGGGYLPKASLYPLDKVGGEPRMTMRIDYEADGDLNWFSGCLFRVPYRREGIKANTNYKMKITYFGERIDSARDNAKPFGLVGKISDQWLDQPGSMCMDSSTSQYNVTSYGKNTGAAWGSVEGTWNSGSNLLMPNLHVALENVKGPGNDYSDAARAQILSVSVREDLGSGKLGPEILSEPSMEYESYYPEYSLLDVDGFVELARKHGIYLKLVILEKDAAVFRKIDDDGTFVFEDNGETDNMGGFYAGRTRNKNRWLQEAWYRYLQARWGYSTSIHSWELNNEGPPFDASHSETADELGKSMHCRVFGVAVAAGDGQKCTLNHPNAHMVTTSMWHSFPAYSASNPGAASTWGDPRYPNLDYADGHAYISTSLAPPSEKQAFETDCAYYHLWHSQDWSGWNLKLPIVRGEGGMVPAQASTDDWNSLGIQNDTSGLWFHNFVWSAIDSGAVYEFYWYYTQHIYDPNNSLDHRHHFKKVAEFMANVPLNNGSYQDLAATVSGSGLRVVGQKDSVKKNAYLWVQNQNHTWKNSGAAPVSGLVSIGGFEAGKSYPVQEWDTYAGTAAGSSSLTADGSGTLTLQVSNLATDKAFKIGTF